MTTSTDRDPFGLDAPAGRADPYPVYARLRAEAPAHFSETWGGWLITRHADVSAAFRDERLSANRAGRYAATLPAPVRERLAPLLRNLASWILLSDPPEHTRVRGLLGRAFTPRLVEHLRPRIRALAGELLDPLSGRVDLVAALAGPLPVIVIGEMLGLPPEDRHRLKGWSDSLAAFMGAARLSMEVAERALHGINELEDYFRALIAEKRRSPGEDLLSALIAAEDRGVILGEQELLSTCSMVLFGGHETTTNLIGNGLLVLQQHPGAWAALREAPEGMAAAVDEILRYESPVQRMGRVAREEVEIGGQRIPAGDRVWMVMGAANRDPAVFPDPDRLDVSRRENRQLSFGIGPHYCIGAALGRMEAEIALDEVLRRFPRMEPAEVPRWLDNLTIRGLRSLEVDL